MEFFLQEIYKKNIRISFERRQRLLHANSSCSEKHKIILSKKDAVKATEISNIYMDELELDIKAKLVNRIPFRLLAHCGIFQAEFTVPQFKKEFQGLGDYKIIKIS